MIATPMPCIWFDDQAEDAAKLYTSVIPNSRVVATARYPQTGQEITGKEPGSVMTVDLELNGQRFQLLNGGPHFTPDEAISFVLECDTQEEIDELWERLAADGGEHGQCGWLKDRFGVSWQVTPAGWTDLVGDSGSERFERAMAAMLTMTKLDIAELQRAADGETVGAG